MDYDKFLNSLDDQEILLLKNAIKKRETSIPTVWDCYYHETGGPYRNFTRVRRFFAALIQNGKQDILITEITEDMVYSVYRCGIKTWFDVRLIQDKYK